MKRTRRAVLASSALAASALAGCNTPLFGSASDDPDEGDTGPVGGEEAAAVESDWQPDGDVPQSVKSYWPARGPVIRPASSIDNPVLTADTVDSMEAYSFADPFVAWTDRRAYMFFEVKHGSEAQDIGYATSGDFLNWTFQGLALQDEERVYSYPMVFRRDGRWLMIPSLGTSHSQIEIYEAVDFPRTWRVTETISNVAQNLSADATVWERDGTVYLTFEDYDDYRAGYYLRLFTANSLLGADWTEHPESPITHDTDSRPGGRPIVHDDGVDVFRQVRDPTYGRKLIPYRITKLSADEYQERKLETSPTVAASEEDGTWNEAGMHHADFLPARSGVSQYVPVDGKDSNGVWSIGMYSMQYVG